MVTALSKATLVLIVITFTVFGNCNGFYRPMPSFLDKTINIILNDQLARRFNLPTITTTTPAPEVEQLEQLIKVHTKNGIRILKAGLINRPRTKFM